MDPKGRLSSEIHFLVPLGITYSDSLHCGNTLDQIYWHANQSKVLLEYYCTSFPENAVSSMDDCKRLM